MQGWIFVVILFQIEKAVSCNIYLNASPFSQETKISFVELLCSYWNENDPDLLTLEFQIRRN